MQFDNTGFEINKEIPLPLYYQIKKDIVKPAVRASKPVINSKSDPKIIIPFDEDLAFEMDINDDKTLHEF